MSGTKMGVVGEREPEFIARIRANLRSLPRGLPSGRAPRLAYGRHAGPAAHDGRPAAVLLLLFQSREQWQLPLIKRVSTLRNHAGQISLPGGRCEAGESPAECAVRECQEELGVDPGGLTLLGDLPAVYIFSSNFVVYPWLAYHRGVPRLTPDPGEVADVVELPLTQLGRLAGQRTTIRRGPLEFLAPHLPCGPGKGDTIWGATHVILEQLATLCHTPSATGPAPLPEARG